jgi:hypothetical protein
MGTKRETFQLNARGANAKDAPNSQPTVQKPYNNRKTENTDKGLDSGTRLTYIRSSRTPDEMKSADSPLLFGDCPDVLKRQSTNVRAVKAWLVTGI